MANWRRRYDYNEMRRRRYDVDYKNNVIYDGFPIFDEVPKSTGGVYVFKDRYEKVLYIGETNDFRTRFHQYVTESGHKSFFPVEVRWIELYQVPPNITTRYLLEQLLIERLNPIHNSPKQKVNHNKRFNKIVIEKDKIKSLNYKREHGIE